jgi:methyl-accepting chemotaxis protein
MSAKAKILLLIGLLFTSIILLVSGVGFANFKSASVENYTNKLDNQAFLMSKAIEQKMGRYFDALNIMANDIELDENGLLNIDRTVAELNAMTDKLGVLNTYIAIENGATYAAVTNGLISGFNAKEKKREWYTRGFDGEAKIVTTPYISAEKEAVMAVAVPVKRAGKVLAVLSLNLAVNQITEYVESLMPSKHVYVSRADGYLLAAKTPEQIGKNLFELRPSYKQFQNDNKSNHSYDFEGNEYQVVSARINSLGWTVWTWDAWSNINSASNDNLKVNLLMALVLIVISLYIVYMIVMKIMYLPIGGEPKEIEAIVKKIAQGNLNAVPLTSGKETGVYSAIITMVDSLKGIVEHINTSTVQLSASSTEMSESAASVNSNSESQMQQLEQTSTAMNEMTVTVDEVARNALQASTAADEANNHSSEGILVVDEMNTNISTLVDGITGVQDVMNKLEGEIDSIGNIIEVIRGISEQTNLLALNAAIEAARAGEQGRGFAVVADEVRSLANRTQDSTNEIQAMISSLQNESKNSVELMQVNVNNAQSTAEKSTKANQALQAIRSSVSVIQDMNNQIATSAEEQTLVAGEINSSIVGINDLAKVTFDSSKDNTNRAQELSHIASSLNDSVKLFKL